MWKVLLTAETIECIGKCLDFQSNSNVIFICRPFAFRDTFRKKSHKDDQAAGILAKMPTKFSVLLWRVSWGFINTFKKVQEWGINIQTTCLLCNNKEETIFHLFINCTYTRKLLLDMTEALWSCYIWKTQNTPLPRQEKTLDMGHHWNNR